MLARERFQTETPNVIDPGEDSPPLPTRRRKDQEQDDDENHNDPCRRSLARSGDSGIRDSLYTRTGNKGVISRGIKLMCVPNGENDDERSDGDVDNDNDETIVFERSSSHGSVEFFDDEDNNPVRSKKKKNHKKKKNKNHTNSKNPNRRLVLNDDDDENGIAQARLFAAAMLNESEKRQRSMRNLMTNKECYDGNSFRSSNRQEPSSTLRQMMQRASSFRNNGNASGTIIGSSNHSIEGHNNNKSNRSPSVDWNSMHRTSSFRSLGRNSNRINSFRHKPERRESITIDEQCLENIWLVDDTDGVVAKAEESSSSKTNLFRNRLIRVVVPLVVGILLVVGFSVAAVSWRSSLRSSSTETAANANGNNANANADADANDNVSAAEVIAGNARLGKIVAFLSDSYVSSAGDLYEASSPQFRAALWMAEEDFEQLRVPKPGTVVSPKNAKGWSTATTTSSSAVEVAAETSPFNFVQRYVLAVLYFAVGGTDWIENYRFASTDWHECSWYEQILLSDSGTHMNMDTGTDVDVDTEIDNDTGHADDGNQNDALYSAMGVMCDRDLQVRGIVLPSNNLRGSIPSEIQYLSNLQVLRLNDNFLTGTIPENLRYLSHLVELELGNNFLTGHMTPYYWLGERLTKLEHLDLSYNRLDLLPFFQDIGSTGGHNNSPRRESIGGETSLARLALGGNSNHNKNNNIMKKEEGSSGGRSHGGTHAIVLPSEFRYLTNLRELALDNMGLGGKIPTWLFRELPELHVLDLSHNHLTGTIVDGVRGTGSNSGSSKEEPSSPLPTPPLQHLEALILHDNALTGTLPEFIGLLPKLATLTLHHNNVTVGTNAANFICWRDETVLESMTTDCGDVTCPCCIENCCDSEDCYKDVDWGGNGGSSVDAKNNGKGDGN